MLAPAPFMTGCRPALLADATDWCGAGALVSYVEIQQSRH